MDFLSTIFIAIHEAMHRRDEVAKRFICTQDLREIWVEHGLQPIFPSRAWNPQDIELVRSRYLKILSILIYIGIDFRDLVAIFRTRFFNLPDRRSDGNLPFSESELDFLTDQRRHSFYVEQYAFVPQIIEERDVAYIQEVPSMKRLPFIEDFNQIGFGGYGRITEITIAPRHFYNQTRSSDNVHKVKFACKTYRNERSQEDFRTELKRLDYLKETIGGGSHHLMIHLASLIHGNNNCLILLPLAELRDLEIFLRGGNSPLANTRELERIYDFEKKFPNLTDPVLHKALFEQMEKIAAALVWLHDELEIHGSTGQSCAHMDLKPENILLTSNEGSAVGKWWISDFGISVFDRNNHNQNSEVYSIRNFGRRLTSNVDLNEPDRAHGPYQPPEIDENIIDPQKCDIWSFGGVLIDVLAFAVGRTVEVETVRSARFNGRDDFFYEVVQTVDDSNTIIRHNISTWLQLVNVNPNHPWIDDCIDIIRKTLKIKPDSRPSARTLLKSLKHLNKLICGGENSSSEASSSQRSHSITHEEDNTHSIEGNSFPSPADCADHEQSSRQSSSHPPNSLWQNHQPEGNPQPIVSMPYLTRDSHLDFYQPSTWPLYEVNLKLPKKSKIIDVAISATNGQLAFLSREIIYICNNVEQGIMSLVSDVNWQRISLGGQYLAIYGIGSSGQKMVRVLDLGH